MPEAVSIVPVVFASCVCDYVNRSLVKSLFGTPLALEHEYK